MAGIRIDDEHVLKIEDAMQVKGRQVLPGLCGEVREDHESQSASAA
jgi:hypothetical protein